MKTTAKLLTASMIALGAADANALSFGASGIGLNFAGTGTSGGGFVSVYHLNMLTDVGVSQNESGSGGGLGVGDVNSFHLQDRISGATDQNNNTVSVPLGGNSVTGQTWAIDGHQYQLTEQLVFNEKVTFSGPVGSRYELDTDTATAQPGAYQMRLYLVDLTNNPNSLANPSGATGAECYGPAVSGGPVCAGSANFTDILDLKLRAGATSYSSFSATSAQNGSGSYHLEWDIGTYNSNYVSLLSGTHTSGYMDFTGTINQPVPSNVPTPNHSWDGIATAGNEVFKVDGSKEFAPMPEPGSIALLGIGMSVMVAASRRKKAR